MLTREMSFLLLAAAVLAAQPATGFAQGSTNQVTPGADRALLKIVAVEVLPAGAKAPATVPPPAAPDTLYRLRVKLRNNGTEPASYLAFQVTVSGRRLAPYINHTFMTPLPPGAETDVPLYNFWSSEAGRPFPSDGRLVVEVRLTGARWTGTGAKQPSDVQPLPAPFVVTLTAKKGT